MRKSDKEGLSPRSGLSKSMKARHFFVLAFGCIIGATWIIVMGDWLGKAGPLGAMIAYALGALIIMTVGLCYAEVATILPAAGGEVVYSYEIKGTMASYIVGWLLVFSYVGSTALMAISTGWIVNTLFPGSEGMTLYSSGGEPVQLGTLIIGLSGMIVLTVLSYRGIKSAATFQEVLIYVFLALCAVFILAGIIWGKGSHIRPVFAETGTGPVLGGILAVFIMTPYFLSGFNVIPHTMEEKAPGTSLRLAGRVILMAIGAAGLFYVLVILSTSLAVPWKDLLHLELPVAGAFTAAFRSPILGKIVLVAGLLGIITTWNTCFIVTTRIIFALSRARIISPVFSQIHPVHKSPHKAVLFVGLISSLGVLLGKRAVLPIVNTGSFSIAVAWASTCFVLILLRRRKPDTPRPHPVPGGVVTAVFALVSCLFFVVLALYQPYLDAARRIPMEWIILTFWGVLGLVFWLVARTHRNTVTEEERRKLMLGKF